MFLMPFVIPEALALASYTNVLLLAGDDELLGRIVHDRIVHDRIVSLLNVGYVCFRLQLVCTLCEKNKPSKVSKADQML
jgi:hypothetical protein